MIDLIEQSSAIIMESPKSISDKEKEKVPPKEEDDSHLPPCLQRRNREHSSSSEDEEGEPKTKKDHAETSDSESDSDASPARDTEKEGTADKASKKSSEKEVRPSKKSRHSKSKSRSRSRSPTKKRHRKSSDRSVRSRHSRSRSRDRHRRKKRSNRSRSKDRRRSRDREHKDHHRRKHRRSSRSRSKDRKEKRSHRRSRSRDRKRSHRSRSRDRSSRDRKRSHRSRSASPGSVIKFGDKVIKPGASFGRPPSSSKPLTFKEKMRQQLIKCIEDGKDVNTSLMNADGSAMCMVSAGTHQSGQTIPLVKLPTPLMGTMVTATAGLAPGTVTPSEAVMQSMLQLQKETTAKTGVEIPSFYNPAAINPVKYAEQVQKRKLLWSKNKDKEVDTKWNATSLSSDSDNKSKEKFRKLMGIHGKTAEKIEEAEVQTEAKQRELFDGLDREYQMARMTTHTHRGIGLGFGSVSYQPLSQPAPTHPPTTSPS